MKQDVTQPTGPVYTPSVNAVLNSKNVVLEEWEIEREISSGYPQRLVAGSGITAATGSVTLAPGQYVASTLQSLISTSSPVKASDRLSLDAGYEETGRSRMITGYVNGVRQSITTNATDVDIIDDIDRLDRMVSHDGLIAVMPPRESGGAWRSIGLYSEYIVDYVLRRAAWYSTPHPRGTVHVHAPMQGSTWAHVGEVLGSTASGESNLTGVNFQTSQDGYSFSDGHVRYGLANSVSLPATVELTFRIDPAKHQGNAYVYLTVAGRDIKVGALDAGIFFWDTTVQANALMTLPDAGQSTIVLRVEGDKWELRDDKGNTATTTMSVSGAIENVYVAASPGACIGGISLTTPPAGESFYHQYFKPTAHLKTGSLHERITVLPDVHDTTVGDVLKEISEALMASMWIDEFGEFQWVHPDRLRSGTISKELTTTTNLFAYTVNDMLSARIAATSVKSKAPSVSASTDYTRVCWTGSGEKINPNESVSYLIEPDSDAVWIDVSRPALVQWDNTYRGVPSSFYGGATNDGTAEHVATAMSSTWEKIRPGLWKLVVTNTSASQQVTQRIPTDSGFAKWVEGDNLPRINAKAKAEFADVSTTSLITGSGVRDYEHDGGYWVQSDSHRRRFADYIASFLSKGIPVVEGIDIIPDTSLQLGDHVRLTDDVVGNLVVHGVVSQITTGGKGADFTMSIKMAVLNVSEAKKTVESNTSSSLVNQVDISERPNTVAQVDANGGI